MYRIPLVRVLIHKCLVDFAFFLVTVRNYVIIRKAKTSITFSNIERLGRYIGKDYFNR